MLRQSANARPALILLPVSTGSVTGFGLEFEIEGGINDEMKQA